MKAFAVQVTEVNTVAGTEPSASQDWNCLRLCVLGGKRVVT